MLDNAVRRRIDPCLDRVARDLARRGIGANQLTWSGFALGILCCGAIAGGYHAAALPLLAANRICDGLDGAVARATTPTDRGAFLDIVLDLIFYAGFVFAFAIDASVNGVAAAFLIFSFSGTGSSFLAYAIMSERRGWRPVAETRKGFAHLGGLTEGAETTAVFVAMLVWPAHFPVFAWIFGALCWLTTVTRLHAALRATAR